MIPSLQNVTPLERRYALLRTLVSLARSGGWGLRTSIHLALHLLKALVELETSLIWWFDIGMTSALTSAAHAACSEHSGGSTILAI